MYLQLTPSGGALVPNVINGEVVPLPSSQNFPVIQGSTGETIHHAQSATVEVGVKAVEAAAEAFKKWKKTPISQRQAVLNKVAEILPTKVEELAKRELPETSCAPMWPGYECMSAAKVVAATATNLAAVTGFIPPSEVPGSMSLVFREPVGVVLCIIP
jgi:acyl-CoA reductase-like NAD-dependent aldehyde dehydrogenase